MGRGRCPGEGQQANPGCHLPPALPTPTLVHDFRGREWTIGKPLGQGGFGAIYLIEPGRHKKVDDGAEYVVKVEPHDNGPLFVEVHALLAVGRQKPMSSWQPRHMEKPEGWVGIPSYHAHGSFFFNKVKLRFLVLDRFGTDLDKVFKGGEKPFPLATVLNIGLQVLNSLEYLHSCSYCHNDIKAANILMDSGGCDVFLVDFGLACKFKDANGFHRDETPDDRRAHEGTLEYASRDAHDGVHSRRGDLESLGLCLVHWSGGRLPWMHLLKGDPEEVQDAKEKYLGTQAIPSFLRAAFHPSNPPQAIVQFWDEVGSLGFRDQPNYSKLRQVFTEELNSLGSAPHEKLKFSGKTLKVTSRRSHLAKMEQASDEVGRKTRSRDEADAGEDTNSNSWQEELSDPVLIMRERSKSKAEEAAARVEPGKEEDFQRRQAQSLKNPTPEMTKIIKMLEERERIREGMNWKEQLQELQRRSKASLEEGEVKSTTPQMEEVMALRTARLAASPNTPETSEEEAEMERLGDEDEAMEVADEVKVVRFAADDQGGKENRGAKPKVKISEEDRLGSSRQLRSRRNTLANLNRHNVRPVLKEVGDKKAERGRRKTLGDLNKEEEIAKEVDEEVELPPLDLEAFRTPPRMTRSTRASQASFSAKKERQQHFGSSSSSPFSDGSDGGSRPTSSASSSRPNSRSSAGSSRPSSGVDSTSRPSSRASNGEVEEASCLAESRRTRSGRPTCGGSGGSRPTSRASSGRASGASTPCTPSPRTSGESYEECKVCAKELNVKSMVRHLRDVHKRSLPDTPVRGSTGFTPAVKKTRRCRDAAVGENKLKQAMREVGEANDAEEGREGNPVECRVESGGVRRKGRRSKGEKSMEEVNQRLARVSVSQESPARIHNVDSPAVVTERRLGAVISSLEKRVRKPVDKFY